MQTNPRITLITLFMIIVIDAMGFGIIFPVLSPLFLAPDGLLGPHASMALRDALYAFTLGLFAVFMFVGTPIFGDLSDSYGRKIMLFLCMAGTAVGALSCAAGIVWSSLTLVFLGRAIGGITAASQSIAQAVIMDVSTETNKTKNLSI